MPAPLTILFYFKKRERTKIKLGSTSDGASNGFDFKL